MSPYSESQRQKILAKYNQLRKAGKTTKEAAKECKVSYMTIRAWETRNGKPQQAKPYTQPAARKDGGLTLMTPSGYKIEGIPPTKVVEVIRALRM